MRVTLEGLTEGQRYRLPDGRIARYVGHLQELVWDHHRSVRQYWLRFELGDGSYESVPLSRYVGNDGIEVVDE